MVYSKLVLWDHGPGRVDTHNKYHRLGGSDNRHVFTQCSQVQEKSLASSVPEEDCVLSLQRAVTHYVLHGEESPIHFIQGDQSYQTRCSFIDLVQLYL